MMPRLFTNMQIFGFLKEKEITADTRSCDVPPPGVVERDGDSRVYFPNDYRLHDLLNGFYAGCNFLELFYSLPEIAAPVHEIASRVAATTWQLRRDWNDEIDYKNEQFNRLFERPNPLYSMYQLVYLAVCYEILTGRQFFFKNTGILTSTDFASVITWWSWPAHQVCMNLKRNVNIYTATELSDLVESYKVPVGSGGTKEYPADRVLPMINNNLKCLDNIERGMPLIMGAEKAIKNLIPVYEARGVIYIKRGAMGFVVSQKGDDSGLVPLTPSEKKELRKDFQDTYGLTGGRETLGVTSIPVRFEKTAMSIKEMEPFAETLADAAAIYAVLRVPPHLIPSKDKSTYANANSDMKAFYQDVIIPWAEKYAKEWTEFLGLKSIRRYVSADFSKIDVLQENKKEKSEVDYRNGETMLKAWANGAATLNQWLVVRGEDIVNDPLYEKYIFQMEPEEIAKLKEYINFKSAVNTNENGTAQTASENSGVQA